MFGAEVYFSDDTILEDIIYIVEHPKEQSDLTNVYKMLGEIGQVED